MDTARPQYRTAIPSLLALGAAGASLLAVAAFTVWQLLDRHHHRVHTAHAVVEIPSVAPLRPPTVVEGETYFEFQVERPVVPLPGNAAPIYPPVLRAAGVEGEVLAQFVVDVDGRAVPGTFKVLKSSHEMLTRAVRTSVEHARFAPAEIGGVRVRQLVQQPFVFQLTP